MSAKELQHLSDEELLEYYHRTRNLKAFRQLYARHKDSLYRYCIQINVSHATGVLEKLWNNLLERPPQLGGRLLHSWLFIQLNKKLRKYAQQAADIPREMPEPDNPMLAAIQRLPRIERNILLLYLECRLPLATVADIEQVSLKKCRAFYHSGRQRLQEILGRTQRQPWRIEEVSV